MLTDAFRDENVGIEFQSRIDGGSYKQQRLRTPSKIMFYILHDLLFADNCSICASAEGDMKRMVDFGLTISIKKTEVMFQSAPEEPYVEPVITINGQKLKATDKFP